MQWLIPTSDTQWIDPLLFVTYVPIMIALIALATSVITARQNRLHNKLSVRPILNITFDISSASPHKLQASLDNNGTGPAIITEVHMRLDGETVDQPASASAWTELYRRAGLDTARIAHGGRSMGAESVVKAGASVVLVNLYEFIGADLDQLHLSAMQALGRLEFEYCYTSIYGGNDRWETGLVTFSGN